MNHSLCTSNEDNFHRNVAHPRHKGEGVVFLVLDGIFGVFLLTFLWAAEPHGSCLELLPPPTNVDEAVTAAKGDAQKGCSTSDHWTRILEI